MITHYQVPIKIGNVTVRPGDIIFGDIDGVVCVPREIAYDAAARGPKESNVTKLIFSPGFGKAIPFRKSLTRAGISKREVYAMESIQGMFDLSVVSRW